MRVTRPRAEYRPDGFGIGTATPRLSWRIESNTTNLVQIGYEIRLSLPDGTEHIAEGRDTSEQVFVDWPFAPLQSRQRGTVHVRVQTSDGQRSGWSEPLELEAALLQQDDWNSNFICVSESAPAEGVRPGYLLRSEFAVGDDISLARIYATAHGIYTLTLNGQRVGDQELAPGWTSYRHRLRYQTYDITNILRPGTNAIGAELSDGWYRGRLGFHGGIWDNYGTDLSLLLQLELHHTDGTVTAVPLDTAWRTSTGPVLAASLYDGEHYDARLSPAGWNEPGFDDSSWSRPVILPREDFTAELQAPVGVPVRETQTLAPCDVQRMPDGRIRLDFGQNIAGRLRIRVHGPTGHTVTLHHAEVLEGDELAVRPLRSAPSVDSYTLRGNGQRETWTPRFTIHGFRYAELENWPGDFHPDDVEAVVIHSDMERTGWFGSNEPLVNQLHENTVWSMRDNFVDLPTDCPQRDERLGWTGDIQVFAPAASFLYSSGGVLASWLADVAVEQGPTGAIPNFVPWIACGFPEESSAAWGDAAVIVPWTMYQHNGDTAILSRQFTSMTGWVDHLAGMTDSTGLIREGMQLGDWLDPAAPPEDPGAGKTDRYLVASAYLAHSARLTSQAAEVLGRTEEADRYSMLAERTTRAFQHEFLSPAGRLVGETPTSLALTLVFNLIQDPDQRTRAGSRLADLVREGDYRVQTGFVGTPVICDALALTGNTEDAYRLLLEKECPSWLYPVSMGATTIWERWDSMLPDGTVNPGEMTSFNHYALGAVVDFLHRVLAGLAPTEPGYRRLTIAPQPGLTFTSARAQHVTPYGLASVEWTLDDDVFSLEVIVPPGATADIHLPGMHDDVREVGSGKHHFRIDTRSLAEVA
ncbi:alpha-L-rhamnosidase [Arthrobacter sedimenti]|uniref:alpha-L-rhamnosidase n=1 Tax=Arthrobacter sedimenti TaxID=2694931 RepID=UPI000B35DFD8|nr:alpha-L-rhamnosidase [Arthrobacter sedimenti]OUM41724.1 alpha-L-rhamnosidase [Arthrobacter agilis]